MLSPVPVSTRISMLQCERLISLASIRLLPFLIVPVGWSGDSMDRHRSLNRTKSALIFASTLTDPRLTIRRGSDERPRVEQTIEISSARERTAFCRRGYSEERGEFRGLSRAG